MDHADSFDCFELQQVVREMTRHSPFSPEQALAAIELLDSGNTIPFVARYRKEATGNLDENMLRRIEDQLSAARDLAGRKTTILRTIDSQGALTLRLHRQIASCTDRKTLEDLYLPYKPKRRTRAMIAREKGLQPLADLLMRQHKLHQGRKAVLQPFVSSDKGVPDADAALAGACDIVAELWSESTDIRRRLLRNAKEYGEIVAQVRRGKKDSSSKFRLYFDHREPVKTVPSHRFLAMKRGEAEGVLRVKIELEDGFVLEQLQEHFLKSPLFEFHEALQKTVSDCYRRLLLPTTESFIMQELKEAADAEAIQVFSSNLRQLLLAPPAGPLTTIGIDPGFRTGCKVAVVDGTGRFLDHATIYPTPPRSDTEGAWRTLKRLVDRYHVKLIAIGNGTASRETEAFVSQQLSSSRQVFSIVVNEAGASVYSASELAGREYPELDVTIRGAVSIAHRLQDPLAELVKIDPKSIGVGQYQHDVNQVLLRKALDREVESCVNLVGVDLNLASAPLLSHVAGIGPALADSIVRYRDHHGGFSTRQELLKVPKLGAKTFQQAAGFLRLRDGAEPLDASAVHPESYYVVDKMAQSLHLSSHQLVGNPTALEALRPADFVDQQVGLPTIKDILGELAKPGRDPRNQFRFPEFDERIQKLEDVAPGMVLEGVVTNVAAFGAFVNLGVHQDGLIHISQLADHFVRDPGEVVAVGDIVRVKVLEVDLDRQRISLSRRDLD